MNVFRLDARMPGSVAEWTRARAVHARSGPVSGHGACGDHLWRVVSGAPGIVDAMGRASAGGRDPERGSLVIECRFDGGVSACRPVLRCHGRAGGPSSGGAFDLALIAHPASGLGLFMRRHGQEFRADVAWPDGGAPALLRLVFTWDVSGGGWVLAAEDCVENRVAFASGGQPVTLPLNELGALFACGGEMRDPSVAWLGLAEGRVPLGLSGRLGAGAMLRTPAGHVAASQIKAGDMVITRDRGAQPVRAAGIVDLPAYGSNVPIVIRANYLGARLDLPMLPHQRIAVGGADVEYLFGEDEVLVDAACFVDDRTVIRHEAGGRIGAAYVLLDEPDLICANGCWVESLWHDRAAARPERLAASGLDRVAKVPVHDRTVRRVLKDYEARTLAALRLRSGFIS